MALLRFTPPDPELLAKYRADYRRRQAIFIGTGVSGFLLWIPVMIGAGDHDGIRLGYLLGFVIVCGSVGLTVWRCPRCSLMFGRAWRIQCCPDCGLQLEDPSRPAA